MPPLELNDLYIRPGLLFRRAHQIAVGIFVQECAPLALTPAQHSTLFVVGRRPGLSQAEVARALGFDRATVGQIIEGLVLRGFINRSNTAVNKRDKVLELSSEGKRLLHDAEDPIRRTSERLMSPLSKEEQKQLMELLVKVTSALNSESRTPLMPLKPDPNEA